MDCVMRVLALCALALAVNSVLASGACLSKVDAVYRLPNTPIAHINKFLARDSAYVALRRKGCPDARPDGDACYNKPAVGSGLTQLWPRYFLGLTDRGANQDCETLAETPKRYHGAVGKKGKGFSIPRFAPTIVHFSVGQSRTLTRRLAVPLRGSDGTPISGISNTDGDDVPYGPDCRGDPMPLDPSGLDTEDMGRIPGTDYVAIVDEYSPSVVLANFKTGRITARHVPKMKAPMLQKARYPIIGDIPDVYAYRRKNRGFESVVVDKEGKYVIAILQSPMLGPDSDKTELNAIIRCAFFDLSVNRKGVPMLKYARSFAIEASPPAAYANRNVPKDLKYSGGQYHSPGKFVALERAKGQVKLFLVDWSKATNIDETKFADNLDLERNTNGARTAEQEGVLAASKTLIWDSLPGLGGTKNYDGPTKLEGFAIDMHDPTKVWFTDDNDFGIEGNPNTRLFRVSLGRSSDGATVCDAPEHPPEPKINVTPSNAIRLVNSATFRISKTPGGGAAENLDVDEQERVGFVANDETGAVDSYDLSVTPVKPRGTYTPEPADFKPTAVSVCSSQDRVAVGLANSNDTLPGRVDILTKDLKVERTIERDGCVLPDSVKFSDDCGFLVVACEGEGKDVPGGVMVIDLNGPKGAFRGARVADFTAFDSKTDELRAKGVRLVESDKASLDLQPEYVTILGNQALVTVQEANAIAVVDLFEAAITELKPIGFIDHSRRGFGIDASNKDDGIRIWNFPRVYGIPQPDTIGTYKARDGMTYMVIANEGDAIKEDARGADFVDPKELNRSAPVGLKMRLKDDALLGRLEFSTIDGYNAETNVQENMFHFGSRSFSILSLDGRVVFDSGEWFERIMQKSFANIFNANGFDDEDLTKSQADLKDNRSDDKGGEPESLALLTTKDGTTYAFIGLERPSIIVVFDISDPTKPTYVNAVANNPATVPIGELFKNGKQGDLDPEGLFASLKLRKLIVSGSVSNTVSTYDIAGL